MPISRGCGSHSSIFIEFIVISNDSQSLISMRMGSDIINQGLSSAGSDLVIETSGLMLTGVIMECRGGWNLAYGWGRAIISIFVNSVQIVREKLIVIPQVE